MRLDRYLTLNSPYGRKEVRRLLGAGKVSVDGQTQRDCLHEIHPFSRVELEGVVLQSRKPVYLALNKPAGYLSATKDDQHPTVMELIPEKYHDGLHIAGRLDRASTGLLLLTNDSKWSWAITSPENKVTKTYLVGLKHPVSESTKEVFANGIYFAYEDLTTQPTDLDIIDSKLVRIYLKEGRYHQIKRMFHAVGNKVISLHRESIGSIQLQDIDAGSFRYLTDAEIAE